MTITIISVGQTPKAEIATLVSNFTKRLPKTITVSWLFVKHGKASDPRTSKQQEAENILKKIPTKSKVIVLDERGKELTSPQLANRIFNQSLDVTFVIGGAYGVSPAIIQRANFIWSLGQLVLPHQIVRLILAEQLYRAHCIHTGHPYHHE